MLSVICMGFCSTTYFTMAVLLALSRPTSSPVICFVTGALAGAAAAGAGVVAGAEVWARLAPTRPVTAVRVTMAAVNFFMVRSSCQRWLIRAGGATGVRVAAH